MSRLKVVLVYWMLFQDKDDGEGLVIPPKPVLRIRVEREEVSSAM